MPGFEPTTGKRNVLSLYIKLGLFALAYLMLGKLSLPLAIPPSYAAPIFPPAGIALAALLLFGYRMGIAIWFGSFLLNLSSGSASENVPLTHSLFLATAVGIGAALQAATGTFLIRQFISKSTALTRPRDIVLFLLLGGPAATLVGASISVFSLLLKNVLSFENYTYAWWNWWIGDTIGVFIFTPLLLIFLAKPREIWARRRVSVGVPLLFILFLNTVILFYVGSREHKRIELRFELAAGALVDRVRKSIEGYLNALYALQSVMVAMPQENRQAFQAATQRWFSIYPGIRDLSWNPRVFRQDRETFEQKARDLGFTQFSIVEPAADGELRRSPDYEEYFPSFLISPERVTDVVGYNQSSNRQRRVAMDRARDTAEITATPAVKRVQMDTPNPDFAFLVYVPIYNQGGHATLVQRRQNLRGFGKAVYRIDDIVLAATNNEFKNFFIVDLYDGEPSQKNSLYSQIPAPSAEKPKPLSFQPNYASIWRQSKISLADRTLWLRVVPTETYFNHQRDFAPWIVLGSMFIMTGLFVALFLTFTGHALVIEKQLLERKRISEKLVKTNAELEQFAYVASHDLQEPLRMVSSYIQLIERRLAGSPDKAILEFMEFAVDGARRMQTLIRDLLRYSRVGRSGNDRQTTDLQTLLKVVLQNLKPSIQESSAEIIVDNLPRVEVLRAEWIQLFQNLVSNAIKYRAVDRPLRIEISAQKEKRHWLFSVHDNGIGIPSESLDRIFLVFQRLHDRAQYPGTGVGLAICKKIVEGHGGTLWVESMVGRGSSFKFSFPA